MRMISSFCCGETVSMKLMCAISIETMMIKDICNVDMMKSHPC